MKITKDMNFDKVYTRCPDCGKLIVVPVLLKNDKFGSTKYNCKFCNCKMIVSDKKIIV